MEGAHLMVNFGEKIKQLREEKGMTQQSLADKLYVTRQAVSRWEHGVRYPDLLTVKKIAQVLDVSVDELLSGEELQENLGNKSIPEKPVEHGIQIVLYGGIAIICIYQVVRLAERIAADALPSALIGTPYRDDIRIVIVYYLGRLSRIFLLCYQAYIWNKKKGIAYKK